MLAEIEIVRHFAFICLHLHKKLRCLQDAVFHPSTFGEPLDALSRPQGRTYPGRILRVLGDSDVVASLTMWLDCVSYTLRAVNGLHVPALTA
jgi:hypothetical protein